MQFSMSVRPDFLLITAPQVPWAGPRLELAVGCGGLSAGRSDWLVEKATELGAHSLRPLLCERTSSALGAEAERVPILPGSRPSRIPRLFATVCLSQVCRSVVPRRRLPQGAAEEGQGSFRAGRGQRPRGAMGTHRAGRRQAVPQACLPLSCAQGVPARAGAIG